MDVRSDSADAVEVKSCADNSLPQSAQTDRLPLFYSDYRAERYKIRPFSARSAATIQFAPVLRRIFRECRSAAAAVPESLGADADTAGKMPPSCRAVYAVAGWP